MSFTVCDDLIKRQSLYGALAPWDLAWASHKLNLALF